MLDRTFAAVVVRWGRALSPARPGGLRAALEELSRYAVEVAFVGDQPLADLDRRLGVRPPGPGTLLLCAEGGTRTVEVGPDGPVRGAEPTAAPAGSDDPARSELMDELLDRLDGRGIGPGLVLVVGTEFGALDGRPGRDAALLTPAAARCTVVSVGPEPGGVPPGVLSVGGGAGGVRRLLNDQCRRHRAGRVPEVDEDPRWVVRLPLGQPLRRRVDEALLALADGRLGTRGGLEEDGAGSSPLVLAAGVYTGTNASQHLLAGPIWTCLSAAPGEPDSAAGYWLLDLRTGVLERRPERSRGLRSLRFASVVRPGVVGLRAESGPGLTAGPALRAPDGAHTRSGQTDGAAWVQVHGDPGGITAAATQRRRGGRLVRVERLAGYRTDGDRVPGAASAVATLRGACAVGFPALLAEQRAGWARRWSDAAVTVRGDPDTELAVRFAVFHLLGSAADAPEAAVGARGLTGPGYAGHVFWDADVFVLPALAALAPGAARAVLGYRLHRLEPARTRARLEGRAGARFPWESAADGTDATPRSLVAAGRVVPVRTGDLEVHVVADIAWSAWHYARWAGDEGFLEGAGRPLLVETARYWADRCRTDEAGRAHLDGVMGPDEYHGPVDDSAFTNVMARWNLRRGADLQEATGRPAAAEEAARWRRLADALVDGYDPASGRFRQFAGFEQLEPLLAADVAEPPVAADLLLGPERVARTQLVKQADVLMLHHLVPDELPPASLLADLDYYGPRTVHGSSLSPAIHAAVLARAGRADEALTWLQLAARLDLDDLTGMTAAGLHLATMGGVWQAVAFGFLGLRSVGEALRVDPALPSSWEEVDLRLRFRGRRVRVQVTPDGGRVRADGPLGVVDSDGRSGHGTDVRLVAESGRLRVCPPR